MSKKNYSEELKGKTCKTLEQIQRLSHELARNMGISNTTAVKCAFDYIGTQIETAKNNIYDIAFELESMGI